MSRPRPVICPTCKKEGDWLSLPSAPFCSRRCRLVDLGKWFGEEHRISDPLRPEHLDQIEDLPTDPAPPKDDP